MISSKGSQTLAFHVHMYFCAFLPIPNDEIAARAVSRCAWEYEPEPWKRFGQPRFVSPVFDFL
jgi:hypothetical protein